MNLENILANIHSVCIHFLWAQYIYFRHKIRHSSLLWTHQHTSIS